MKKYTIYLNYKIKCQNCHFLYLYIIQVVKNVLLKH